jgi:two-component system nitrogen regulation sensor histidine kinase NtrY
LKLKHQIYLLLLLFIATVVVFAGHFYHKDELLMFYLCEALLLLFIPLSFILVNRAMLPMEFVENSQQLLTEDDLSIRIPLSGDKQLDTFVSSYNSMLEHLHKEQLKLGEQRGFFDRLLQATPTGIVIFDFDSKVSNINAAAAGMLAITEEKAKGQLVAQLDSILANAIVKQQQQSSIINLVDGRRFRVQSSQFYDRGFKRNFMQLTELTEELHASDRNSYETLIRMISHELNNTIGATNSLLEACQDYCLQMNNEDSDDFSNALKVVIDRNYNLSAFMGRLADVVHLPVPHCSPTNIIPLIKSTQIMFSQQCAKRNISWREQFESSDLMVNIDSHQFEQVLINVVKNAYEAIEYIEGNEDDDDDDGTITINVKEASGKVILSIEDSAGSLCSIDESHLFQPFYTNKADGQGIGLMLSREILNQHGFKYRFECESGQWTRFIIEMPLCE